MMPAVTIVSPSPSGAGASPPSADALRGLNRYCAQIADNVERVIVGKRDVIELVIVALLVEGHVLLEDVPGTGKTMLARALAASIGGTYKRIQFTPDLLPNDVTGVSVFNQKTQEFEFRSGPAFTNVLLADEINRATPRTQSALLESMGEHQVTVEGEARALPRPFLVLATQNPIEYEGTFPLPEAQLDRFLMRLRVGYPALEDEQQILENLRGEHPIERLAGPTLSHRLMLRPESALRGRSAESILTAILESATLSLGTST